MNCKIKGCIGKHKGLGYCVRHYQQIKTKGEIMKYGRKDFNPIVIKGNRVEMLLYKKNDRVRSYAIVCFDKEDLPLVRKYRWSLSGKGYAATTIKGKSQLMHKMFLKHRIIDHFNQNKLDNRRSNLRKADETLNNINKQVQKNNKSGYRGVYFKVKYTNCNGLQYRYEYWVAAISFKGKRMELGCFKTKEEAVSMRKKAELKYFKNYVV